MDRPLLTIKDFACFESTEIAVNSFCVLLGPQASGKSLAVKLIYFFQSVCCDFVELAIKAESRNGLLRTFEERFSRYFPPPTCGSREFTIQYALGSEWITVIGIRDKRGRAKPLKIKVSVSQFFTKLFADARMHLGWAMSRMASGSNEDFRMFDQVSMRSRAALRSLSDITGREMPSRQIFIPAGRSFFSLLDKNIYRFLQGADSLDPFFGLFGASYDLARSRRIATSRQRELEANEPILSRFDDLVKKILCGNVTQRRDKTYITVDHDREVPLEIGSSGQQEAVPMFTVLRRTLFDILWSLKFGDVADQDAPMLFFEEPEAHLFPLAQKDIVDLLALVFSASAGRAKFIITTHSPYVLGSINVAIQRNHSPEFQKFHGEIRDMLKRSPRLPLDAAAVSAFSVESGKVTPIMDKDTGLIDAKIIDQASDAIYEELDSIVAR